MKRVPFQIVNAQVDKMMMEHPIETDEQWNNLHKKVNDFVLSCGWDAKSFIAELFEFNKSN